MPAVINRRVLFNAVPDGVLPDAGKTIKYDTSESIDLDSVSLEGGALVKLLELSIDPYIVGRMVAAKGGSPIPPYTIGQPVEGFGVGIVVRSETESLKAGDRVYGNFEFANYSIRTAAQLAIPPLSLKVLDNAEKIPWSAFLGVLGLSGLTGFCGWKEHAHPKKGETAFVSTGAGGVGSLVIQLAKLDGLRVIASAGSDEKVQFMKEIGADVAFNYKTTKTEDVLAKEGPIDIYYDNVGGATLDAALGAANLRARFIECGMIAAIENQSAGVVKNLFAVIAKSISLNGFTVDQLENKHGSEFAKSIPPLVASGQIKYKEHSWNGLDRFEEGLLSLFNGTNEGKAIIHVADE